MLHFSFKASALGISLKIRNTIRFIEEIESICKVIQWGISMTKNYILSEYIEQVMEQAEYDKLEENSFSGRIPSCKGVLVFGPGFPGYNVGKHFTCRYQLPM